MNYIIKPQSYILILNKAIFVDPYFVCIHGTLQSQIRYYTSVSNYTCSQNYEGILDNFSAYS
jgi:hypothetical protein